MVDFLSSDNEANEENVQEVNISDNYVGDDVYLFMKDVSHIPLLTQEEEAELAELSSKGDKDAKDKLCVSNLRWVISIAKKYLYRGVSFLDLIQAGTLGLMHAIDKFDVSKGYRLSTYSSWWIRQYILKEIFDNGQVISLPSHVISDIVKINKFFREYLSEFGVEPSFEDISKAVSIPVKKVIQYHQISQNFLSLEYPLTDDGCLTLGDVIEDETQKGVEEQAMNTVFEATLLESIENLSEREQYILKSRFQFGGCTYKTLVELGEELGISRERVRQLEKRALNYLKKPEINEKLFAERKISAT